MKWKFWEKEVTPGKTVPALPLVVSDLDARRAQVQRVLALAGAGENQVWVAVLALADESARNEHEAALLPSLCNEDRQFNAGRSACAYNFAVALREVQRQAELEARKLKDKE